MRNFLIFIILLSTVFGYMQFKVYKKKEILNNYAVQFQKACQSTYGCIIRPDGWLKFDENSFYDKTFAYPISYQASKNEFEMKWKIATSITLFANGGKGQEFEITKTID